MNKNYDYRTTTAILSGGYPYEEVGVIPNDQSWHNTTTMSGQHTVQYYYRDSNSLQNENSSRVVVTVQDRWTATIDDNNNLSITISSIIPSIVRDDIRGNPTQGSNAKRNIFIRRYDGAPILWQLYDDEIGYAHTIATDINLGDYSFTLAPGQMAARTTIYFRNNVPGHDYDPLPNIYTDVLAMGTEFRNPLPADYRPGMLIDNNGVWQSHNRPTGAANILTPNGWRTMRTVNGGSGTDNPPLIRHPDGYKNMRKIGEGR